MTRDPRSERDPRTEPMPGDVLERFGTTYTDIFHRRGECAPSRFADPCEYHPEEQRAAFDNETHAEADFIVGANGQWRLCAACAARPEFKRLKKKPINNPPAREEGE